MSREVRFRPLGQPGDLGWVVMAHGKIYADEFGWDTSFEALVVRIVAHYAASPDAVREAAWIAEVDGRRAGCVFCVAKSAEIAQLRLLLVDPVARGLGLGRELVQQCVNFACDGGNARMVLWTQDCLVAAARIYLAAGFQLVDEHSHHSFGVDLVGQTYELELAAGG